ncbi:MAG TPA: phenylalanine--tRNA ligase subunit alpha, partial [Thermoanaerobaculia bacterium]|nr:phenylalanine--tRNA ligase subunit alpha [Thermoanaerobaculia bacterium]
MAHASIDDQLGSIAGALDEIRAADAARLAELKTGLLGRKAGALTKVLRALAKLPPEDRKRIGAEANRLKVEISEAFTLREQALVVDFPANHGVDLTMPGRARWRGAVHPIQ